MSWGSYALGVATPLLAVALIWTWASIEEMPRGDRSWSYRGRFHVFRGGNNWPANRVKGWWLPLWSGLGDEGKRFVRVGTRRTCLLFTSRREYEQRHVGEGR